MPMTDSRIPVPTAAMTVPELLAAWEKLRGEADQQEGQWRGGYEFFLLMTRTLTSLNLWKADSICDTLLSLVCTFLDAHHGGLLLVRGDEDVILPTALRELPAAEVLGDTAARAFWRQWITDRSARTVEAERISRDWPTAPAGLRGGLAAVTIEVQDRPLGILFVAGKATEKPFTAQELAFLSGATGIAGLALTTAEAVSAQQRLASDLDHQVEEASREAQEKAQAVSELAEKLRIIERQRYAIQEMSTPVLQIWDDVLALPVIGIVDSRRAADMMERLLVEIQARQSRFVIIDITGVEVVDTKTADHFIKVVKAAELLGSRCVLTGIRPAVAQTLVEIGVDLSTITTQRNLKEGLRACLRLRREEQALGQRGE